ncbi:bifunctional 5,10-methylenetetrahydrofolate dehydrogenase/5,10-methenyltetrahydrofolate cyclohydrolase [Vibrio sp. D431a]|uniref:bifunctional 5,10-methylenetetrahydrofolate dehydrogenase/5,10-methenyltetrahydrofolate cyclohydrolase n=1 Tax=Vibrio sp. D431a TaxID=2837388 RepID=UPI00255667F6|nr:bifunctional 5,10-methylenetetrahydrofolate dehydrogenase/5,10-methenyltetrahydrofolate cyclohydrolase [Vibrio sp. D431a]MDK9790074.1 bifunctional 5,10-methylenetetrahydrofolate dehydrogenase/5,10-methenyltetrahydrofolate cyclohydrolase [Vibrio sp. D431a]
MKNLIAGLAERKLSKVKDKIKNSGIKHSITIVSVGDDPASQIYIKNKKLKLAEVGIECNHVEIAAEEDNKGLLQEIADSSETPIFFQLPIPDGWVVPELPAKRDVDAFGLEAFGLLMQGCEPVLPCTVQAVFDIVHEYRGKEGVAGLKVAVIGRSPIVGKPLSVALINRQATVTALNSKSNLDEVDWHSFDVVVVATGYHGVVSSSQFRKGQLIIDVGINRIDGEIKGDVFHDNDSEASITPVPNGVGKLTVANLISNIVELS